jgi:hypothetical protein
VVVSAGRRIDASDAVALRFPQQNVLKVQSQIEEFLNHRRPTAVVSSGACGADLLVLQAALNISVPRHVLLPSSPDTFRESSVIDRPGNWGPIYDAVLKASEVEVLSLPQGQEGYLEINRRLLDKAQDLSATHHVPITALVIWNGKSRGIDDVTAHFLDEATRRGIAVQEISTL